MATGDELDLRAVQQTPSQGRRIARPAPHRSHLEMPNTCEARYETKGAGEGVGQRTERTSRWERDDASPPADALVRCRYRRLDSRYRGTVQQTMPYNELAC